MDQQMKYEQTRVNEIIYSVTIVAQDRPSNSLCVRPTP